MVEQPEDGRILPKPGQAGSSGAPGPELEQPVGPTT